MVVITTLENQVRIDPFLQCFACPDLTLLARCPRYRGRRRDVREIAATERRRSCGVGLVGRGMSFNFLLA